MNAAYVHPLYRRALDIVLALLLLFLLLPCFLIISLLICLESRGSIIYKSKRVGTGLCIFEMYKFRSMYEGANLHIARYGHLNQYTGCQPNKAGEYIFVKLKDDPRITKTGCIIRALNLDELPQLFNVLKGDMSIVGNRPLELYEAEKLISLGLTARFLAPAGITGLWQVSRKNDQVMSERERIKFDLFYAQKHSFWLDTRILVKTFTGLLGK